MHQPVEEHRDDLERAIRSSVRQYIQAVGELAMSWTRAPDELEQVAERVLGLAPDMPNVAPLMAERYLGQLQLNWTPTAARSVYCEPGSLTRHGSSLLDSASGWADRAYTTRGYHDAGYVAWVKAQVAAWHKEPGSCIGYLEQCQAVGVSLHDAVHAHSEKWRTITSCTHGASELDKLDRVLQLLDYQRPSRPSAHTASTWMLLGDCPSGPWISRPATPDRLAFKHDGVLTVTPNLDPLWAPGVLPSLGLRTARLKQS